MERRQRAVTQPNACPLSSQSADLDQTPRGIFSFLAYLTLTLTYNDNNWHFVFLTLPHHIFLPSRNFTPVGNIAPPGTGSRSLSHGLCEHLSLPARRCPVCFARSPPLSGCFKKRGELSWGKYRGLYFSIPKACDLLPFPLKIHGFRTILPSVWTAGNGFPASFELLRLALPLTEEWNRVLCVAVLFEQIKMEEVNSVVRLFRFHSQL